MLRFFKLISVAAAKLWQLAQQGGLVTVRFDGLHTAGQEPSTTFPDDKAATRHVETPAAK